MLDRSEGTSKEWQLPNVLVCSRSATPDVILQIVHVKDSRMIQVEEPEKFSWMMLLNNLLAVAHMLEEFNESS